MDIRTTIETGDVVALQELLAAVSGSANAPIRWGKSDEIVTVVDPELLAEAQARGREDVVSALRGEL
jgi:hypothetical protein